MAIKRGAHLRGSRRILNGRLVRRIPYTEHRMFQRFSDVHQHTRPKRWRRMLDWTTVEYEPHDNPLGWVMAWEGIARRLADDYDEYVGYREIHARRSQCFLG